MAKSLGAQTVFTGEPNLLQCSRCHKTFETKTLLTRHERKSHKPDTRYPIIKNEAGFRCTICLDSFKTRYDLKKHFFYQHSDVQTQSHYNKDVAALVGDQHMQTFRTALLLTISKGKFEALLLD
jgi:uncharacterized C2H2 Zn-finger protein